MGGGAGTYLPVGWGGHSLGGRELERVHRSQDLVKVASGGGGVEQRQLQPLVGTDDEHLNAAEKEGGGGSRTPFTGVGILKKKKKTKAGAWLGHLHSGR